MACKLLKNAYFFANIGFDTAKNEPAENWQTFAEICYCVSLLYLLAILARGLLRLLNKFNVQRFRKDSRRTMNDRVSLRHQDVIVTMNDDVSLRNKLMKLMDEVMDAVDMILWLPLGSREISKLRFETLYRHVYNLVAHGYGGIKDTSE